VAGEKVTKNPAAGARPAAAEDIAWRKFPQFEKSFDEVEAALQKIEKTCRQLDQIQRAGTDEEKQRAKVAMAGYARLLELIGHLRDLRDKMVEEKQ